MFGILYIVMLVLKIDIFVELKLCVCFDGSLILIDGKIKLFVQLCELEIVLKFDCFDVLKLILYVLVKLLVVVMSGLFSSNFMVNFVMSGEMLVLCVLGIVDLNDVKVIDCVLVLLFVVCGVYVVVVGFELLCNVMYFDEIWIDWLVVDLLCDKQGVLNVEKFVV